ncbi:TonB-dependent receptor plug domain-containing protein [Marilutibacter alkalisoli]|uniref:TonB-dependent receptor n=1 Tax=Marilutibacter alkalisoli TaxID=2591633 RepID=A0A514BTM9_9GAMM|nr:TonB-dependent receptor [Lysobacter alkalisoli]QDH70732.1 TonB-dependent receptor [Lysobacter alkalisoli]
MKTGATLAVFLLASSMLPAAGMAGAGGAPLCPADSVTCLDRIQVTATKRPESTLDVPAGTTVIGARELRESAPQTVMDALHGAVGTFVQQTTPGQGVVIVRGLKGSEVLHVVDGFRLNNAIFRNSPNQYIALVDSQLVERIEVVRGPMSTLYGSDAMGGVVHMLTRQPRFEGDIWQANGRLRTILGSADRSSLSRVEAAVGREGFALSGGATWQDVGDRRIGGGERLRPTGFTAHAYDLKLRTAVAEGHTLSASVQYLSQPRTPRYDALVPGFGQEAPENTLFLFEPQQRRFAQLVWQIERDHGWFDSAELHLGRQDIIDDRRLRAFGTPGNEDRERNRDTLTGLFGQFGKSLGAAHYLSYGFEWYRDEVASSRTRTDLANDATVARAPRFPNGARMDTQMLYLADDWLIGDRVDLNFGVQYSRAEVRIPATDAMPAVTLAPDALSGSVGISFKLRDDWRLIGNIGRGFRAPNIFDLGMFGERPGQRFNIANPRLEPETVTTVDAGFKFGGSRASGELIAFHSRYRDKITTVETGAVRTVDGTDCVADTRGCLQVVQNRNVTALDLWGVEAGMRYHLDAPALELHASATWTHGEETFEGRSYSADRVPPLFGKAGALWRPRADLGLELYAYYAARQDRLSERDMGDPRINPDGTAGWVTGNARIAWHASDRFDLALRMENLADKRYREHGTGLDAAGRNFILSADYRF